MYPKLYQLVHKPTVKRDATLTTIACIGDSITYGAGVIEKRSRASYPAFLQKMLGKEYQVLNYGLSGRTAQNSADMPYRKDFYYKVSRKIKPDITILMLGTNDTKPYNWQEQNYKKELRALAEEYMACNPTGSVILLQPPKCFPEEKTGVVAFDISGELIEKRVAPIVEKLGDELGISVIDLFHFSETHPEWFVDGVHPNEEGNRNIAERIAEFLKKKDKSR